MSNNAHAQDVIEQFRRAPISVQREISIAILERHFRRSGDAPIKPSRIREIAGRYPPAPENDPQSHDQGFAEAILASKSADGPP